MGTCICSYYCLAKRGRGRIFARCRVVRHEQGLDRRPRRSRRVSGCLPHRNARLAAFHRENRAIWHARGRTSFVAGFSGGAFSVLLAIGIWPISSRTANLAAPAVFGGVYGLILGALALQLLPGDKAERSSLFGAALQNIQEQLGPPVLVNYDGYLDISAKAAGEQGLVLGRLQRKFAPRQGDKPAPEAEGEKRSRILIQGGAEQETVPFVLSIVGNSAVSGYPRRMTGSGASRP